MSENRKPRRTPEVKGPLLLGLVLGAVAFAVTSLVASGGTDTGLRLDLGLIMGGAAFIATVVISATLLMLEKPNDPELGQGTGVNRSSAKIYAEKRAKRQAAEREKARRAEQGGDRQGGASTSAPARDADGGPEFGRRIHPEQ